MRPVGCGYYRSELSDGRALVRFTDGINSAGSYVVRSGYSLDQLVSSGVGGGALSAPSRHSHESSAAFQHKQHYNACCNTCQYILLSVCLLELLRL
jgi:hypothetical protein